MFSITLLTHLTQVASRFLSFKVPPAELENTLLSHPDVADAGVTGLPDQLAGEVPFAYVVLKPGRKLTEQQLHTFINGGYICYYINMSWHISVRIFSGTGPIVFGISHYFLAGPLIVCTVTIHVHRYFHRSTYRQHFLRDFF